MAALRSRCGHSILLRYAIFYIYMFFFSPLMSDMRESLPHDFTYICGILKCFDDKLLAPHTSTRWAKNGSFWAPFRWVVQHITPYLLNASTYLHATGRPSRSTLGGGAV